MLDFDLAILYEVPTKALNQAVKRNSKRFPQDFMFALRLLNGKPSGHKMLPHMKPLLYWGHRMLPHCKAGEIPMLPLMPLLNRV